MATSIKLDENLKNHVLNLKEHELEDCKRFDFIDSRLKGLERFVLICTTASGVVVVVFQSVLKIIEIYNQTRH